MVDRLKICNTRFLVHEKHGAGKHLRIRLQQRSNHIGIHQLSHKQVSINRELLNSSWVLITQSQSGDCNLTSSDLVHSAGGYYLYGM